MESDIIKISHLTKNFGEVKAVNELNVRQFFRMYQLE